MTNDERKKLNESTERLFFWAFVGFCVSALIYIAAIIIKFCTL